VEEKGEWGSDIGGWELSCAAQDGEEELVGGDDGLVHIDLPVHEPSRDDEFLDAVDALLVDDELVVVDVEHRDDAVSADDAFADACEEAVTSEVVETIHVELAGDELVEEMLVVGVAEDVDSEVELSVGVHALHEEVGEVLVMSADDDMLGGVREGAVTDVVQEDGELCALAFVVGDVDALLSQDVESAFHEVESAEHVAETCVHGARIDKAGESELLDAPLALEVGVLEDREYDGVVEREEAVVYGVVYDFVLKHF